MTLEIAIIGAGFARTAILPALRTIPDATVVAVASSRLQSARRAADEFGVGAAYDDWRSMLETHRPDLVCIATPTALHAPMTLAAVEVGAHVLCEKPMALDRHEAKAMLAAAEGGGRVHMIDHELRFNPNRRKVKELIDDGVVGQVRHVELVNVTSNFADPASRPEGDWLSSLAMGGGRLGASGSHQIDLMRWWFGEVEGVSGRLATLVPERVGRETGDPWLATADDFVSFSLEMRSGVPVNVMLSAVSRHDLGSGIRIFGSEGTILLSDTDERLLVAMAGGEFEDMTAQDPNLTRPGILPRVWNVSVVALLEELTSAIRDGRGLREGATFVDGLRCQEVMDAIRVSSAERRWVTVQEMASTKNRSQVSAVPEEKPA